MGSAHHGAMKVVSICWKRTEAGYGLTSGGRFVGGRSTKVIDQKRKQSTMPKRIAIRKGRLRQLNARHVASTAPVTSSRTGIAVAS